MVKVTKLVDNIVRTPLAKVFLVTRLAKNCRLFVPLVVISMYTCLAVVSFRPRDVCSVHLTGGNRLLARRGSQTVLALVGVGSMIRGCRRCLCPSVSLVSLIGGVSNSHHSIFPIIGHRRRLINVVCLSSIHPVVFHRRLCRHFRVKRLVGRAPTQLGVGSPVSIILLAFSGANT